MKRKYINIKTAVIALAVIASASCKKITEINRSPNNPPLESATPEVLIPSGMQSTAGRVGGELAIIGGIWSQFWTQNNASNQYKDIDAYNLQRQDRNGNYNELFAGALADYQLAIKQATASGKNNYVLIATVMKAYTYQVLVDLYDKVPYTEALQGEANLQPKFDDGYTIYKALLAELDAALKLPNVTTNLDNPNIDFVFVGDGTPAAAAVQMSKWVKFANTLKLKMYLRMVNAKPAEAEAGIKALYALGDPADVFLSENAGIASYVNTPDQGNPMYEYNIRRLNTPVNLKASKTFVDTLTLYNDPRIVSYFGTAAPNALTQGDFNSTATIAYTSPVQSASDPVYFITEAESHLMQAEARLRYFGDAGAEAKFNEGVIAAFEERGFTADTIPDNGPGSVYKYTEDHGESDAFNNKLKAIIIQKWISFHGSHALEAFFEQERTGYPKTWTYSLGGVTGGKFPKRLVFPDSERQRNLNTPAEVAIFVPVWWGKTN